jgi:hypothetical protein
MRVLAIWLAWTAAPALTAQEPPRNRLVRVVTVSQDRLAGRDLLEDTLDRLDQSAAFRPDVACLPELFSRRPPEAVPIPPPSACRPGPAITNLI